MLLHTLDLLWKNYLSLESSTSGGVDDDLDIFLFNTGDFDAHDLDVIEPHVIATTSRQQNIGRVKLVNLANTPYWNLPQNLRQDNQSEWLDAHLFPGGHRHMCHFFAVKIWDFFDALNTQMDTNYRYIWRLDEDSLIHS
jgi:hypothetical protein